MNYSLYLKKNKYKKKYIRKTETLKMSKNVGNPTCGPSVWAPTNLSLITLACCAVIAIVATLGNGLIIAAVIKDPLKKLQTPFNFFLVNLAIADLILGSVSMPISVYTHYKESIGELTPLLNNVLRMSYFISGMASLLSLVVMSADRYIALSRAIRYRMLFSWRHCVLITLTIWIVSIAFPFLYFKIGAVNYYMLYACVTIITASITLLFIYIKVYLLLRQQTENMMEQLPRQAAADFQVKRIIQEKKITKTFLVILAAFVSIYLPSVIMVFVLYFWKNFDCNARHVLRDLQSILISANSCMNPIICFWRLHAFSKSVKLLFCKNNLDGNIHIQLASTSSTSSPSNDTSSSTLSASSSSSSSSSSNHKTSRKKLAIIPTNRKRRIYPLQEEPEHASNITETNLGSNLFPILEKTD